MRESRVEFFSRSGAKDVTLSAFSSASAFSPLCRQTPAVDQLPAQNTSDSELLQQIIPQKSHSTESALVLYSSDCPGVEAELCHHRLHTSGSLTPNTFTFSFPFTAHHCLQLTKQKMV